MKKLSMFTTMIIIIFCITVNATPIMMGAALSDLFFLDTSLQKNNEYVEIDKPTFSHYQDYILCYDPDKDNYSSPDKIIISGMRYDGYVCIPQSTLDLNRNESYILIETINIKAAGQTISIVDPNFLYDPWNNGKFYRKDILLYLDSNGVLSYRFV